MRDSLGFCLSTLSFFAIGFVVASLARTSRTAQILAMVLYFPNIFLSGATIRGIPQKAAVFWSKEMQVQKEKTFDKNLQKKMENAQKDLNSLKRQRYACEPDAIAAANKWISDHPLFKLNDLRASLF